MKSGRTENQYEKILADLDAYNAGELGIKEIRKYSMAEVNEARKYGIEKTLAYYARENK
ncbi:MAG: hypothetical protein AAF843_07820 [Bacteroidota bacterium]